MLSAIFDVALGLILVFLVMSIVASSVGEYIGNIFQRRAWNLERFLEGVLLGTNIRLIEDFFNKTMLATQTQNGRRPSYLKAEDFAQALIDTLAAKYLPKDSPAAQPMATADPTLAEWAMIVNVLWSDALAVNDNMKRITWLEHIRKWLRELRHLLPFHLGNPLPLAQVLSAMINQAYGDEQMVRKHIETWYDNAMERVSGWYKGQTQIILLMIGIALAATLNIDTIAISNSLLQNPAVRSVVDDAAKNMSNSPSSAPTTPEQVAAYLAKLNLPIGWPDPNLPANAGSEWWLRKLLGILITGFAVSQGAPFWFDLLNKVTNLRSGGTAPATADASAAKAASTQAVVVASAAQSVNTLAAVSQATVAQAQASTAVAQANTANAQADAAKAQIDPGSAAGSGIAPGTGTPSDKPPAAIPDSSPGLG